MTVATRSLPARSLPLALRLAVGALVCSGAGCGLGDMPAGTDPAAITGSQSRSFQDGVAPSSTYNGTRDAFIAQATPTTASGTATSNRVDGDDPGGSGQDVSALMQWDVSSIPAGSTVRTASITLHVTNVSSGTYQLYAIDRAWTEAQTTWNVAATGSSWQTAGAEGAGDRDATVLGTVSGATATGSYTVALNAAGIARVQSWVDSPGGNHGLIMASTTTADGLDWASREVATVTDRPRLDLTYDLASTDAGTMDSSAADAGTHDSGTDAGTHDSGTDAGTHDSGTTDAGSGFPAGTVCNATGVARTRPAQLQHVIVILMENKSYSAIHGNSNAPYFNSIARQCGYSTRFLDNAFVSDLPSEPHYLALSSGSNCNTGLETSGTACITDDNNPSNHQLNTASIFSQVGTWRSYQEGMPSACYGGTSGEYRPKHNPPVYYSTLGGCSSNDVPIANVSCPTTLNTVCSTPANAFVTALADDTLPAYSFVTPNLLNDMHDGTVAQGDNWLHTYLPRIFASPAYLRGGTAVLVMWDEATPGAAQPNLFISPYVQPQVSSATMNLFAVLRASENALGIATHLGCASGTIPGGGTCPTGSTADLRATFNF